MWEGFSKRNAETNKLETFAVDKCGLGDCLIVFTENTSEDNSRYWIVENGDGTQGPWIPLGRSMRAASLALRSMMPVIELPSFNPYTGASITPDEQMMEQAIEDLNDDTISFYGTLDIFDTDTFAPLSKTQSYEMAEH